MQRKIEVTTEEPVATEAAPDTAPDVAAPDFGDHINAAPDAATKETTSAQQQSASSMPGGAEAYIIALQAELEEANRLKEDAEKRLAYLQAEFHNYRRRTEEDKKEQQKFNNSLLIRDLLPTLDNFERALAAAERSKSFDALVGGVSGTMKQLQAFLQKSGVTPIEALGKEFDPNFHEAIGHTEAGDYAPNTVAEVVQKGYVMHERVLRPALVRVAQG